MLKRLTINKYILREIAIPCMMILFVLTFVLLMGKIVQLMDLMVNKGVSFLDISKLIIFLMPSFLIFTVPISLLISSLIGLGRLSGDNEITVLKVSGVSLYQLAQPIVFASFVAFLITAVVSFFLVPQGNYATKRLLFDIVRQKATVGIKEKVFNDDFKGILIYADKIPVSAEYMEGIIINDNRMIKEPSTIFAQKAYLISDPKTMTITLRLEKGSSHVVDANMKYYRKMDFAVYDVNLDLESSVSDEAKAKSKSSTEMTVAELVSQIRKKGLAETDIRELAIELNKKMTIPFSCIFFGILSIPLGITAQRSVKSRGFTIGFAVVLAYYLLQIGGEALAEMGRISPAVGAWTPNVIFGTLGLYLFVMAARERPLPFHTLFNRWMGKVREKRAAVKDDKVRHPGRNGDQK